MSLPLMATLPATNGTLPADAFSYVDYGPRLTATTWSLTACAALFLGMRLLSKLWRSRSVWWDDYVLIASWLALVASCALLSVCVSLGYGKHNWDIPPENFEDILLYSYAAGFASILAALWSKLSFAITLLRITKGRPRRLLWFIIGSVSFVLGANATVHWVQCWPLERLWQAEKEGSCIRRKIIIDYNIFAAAYSGAADIALALFPWFIIWASTISKKERLGVVISMSMGVFAGVASFLKITTVTAIESNDVIDSVELLIYGTAESASTIMAVSIPMLRALLRTPKTKSPSLNIESEGRNFSYPSRQNTLRREQKDDAIVEEKSESGSIVVL